MPSIILYGRRGCSHCEQLQLALALLQNRSEGFSIANYQYIDVDTDSELVARYGTSVPVLMAGSELVVEGVFDIETFEDTLQQALNIGNE